MGVGLCGEFFILTLALPIIVFTIPVICGLIWILRRSYTRVSTQLRLISVETKTPWLTHIVETSDGLSSLRAFRWEPSFAQKHHISLQTSQRSQYILTSLQVWVQLVMDLVLMGLASLFVAFSTARKDSVSIGLLGLALIKLVSRIFKHADIKVMFRCH